MSDTETFAMLSDYVSNTNIPVSRPVFAFSSACVGGSSLRSMSGKIQK